MSAASAGQLGSWQACGLLDGSRCGVGGPFGVSTLEKSAERVAMAAKVCTRVLTSPTCLSALVRALEAMEEELAQRVIPGERSMMLRQVSKTMRTAMERVRPPAMIKAKRGQRTESVEKGILDKMRWCRITDIDLSNTRIKAEGAGRLAAVLPQCPSLAHLNHKENGIGAEGAGRLATVLQQCTRLAHLNLAWNEIGDEGVGMLAAALPQCPSLAHLNL
jgi:hypothetical protein